MARGGSCGCKHEDEELREYRRELRKRRPKTIRYKAKMILDGGGYGDDDEEDQNHLAPYMDQMQRSFGNAMPQAGPRDGSAPYADAMPDGFGGAPALAAGGMSPPQASDGSPYPDETDHTNDAGAIGGRNRMAPTQASAGSDFLVRRLLRKGYTEIPGFRRINSKTSAEKTIEAGRSLAIVPDLYRGSLSGSANFRVYVTPLDRKGNPIGPREKCGDFTLSMPNNSWWKHDATPFRGARHYKWKIYVMPFSAPFSSSGSIDARIFVTL